MTSLLLYSQLDIILDHMRPCDFIECFLYYMYAYQVLWFINWKLDALYPQEELNDLHNEVKQAHPELNNLITLQ